MQIQTKPNTQYPLLAPDLFSSIDFAEVQQCLMSQVNRVSQMVNTASDVASKAIFSRLVEMKNAIISPLISIEKFFLHSNFDAPSKATVTLALVLACSRVTRAIYETAVNPANIAVHFPTFLALGYLYAKS